MSTYENTIIWQQQQLNKTKKNWQKYHFDKNMNYDGDIGDFDDDDEENYQKTYKYHEFWVREDLP